MYPITVVIRLIKRQADRSSGSEHFIKVNLDLNSHLPVKPLKRNYLGAINDRNSTAKTTVNSYIDLYKGIPFSIEKEYANVLAVSFVAFTFGFGVPLLYLVAFFSLGTHYFFETYKLYYTYIKPPMFGVRLSLAAFKTIKFGPFAYCLFGYLFCSQKNLLSNDLKTINYSY